MAALFPLMFAMLPGLQKGALKVTAFLPQNPLSGYVLLVAPLMQLPMFGAPLAMMIQLSNSWLVAFAIVLLMCALMLPILAMKKGVGPHTSNETKDQFYLVGLCGGRGLLEDISDTVLSNSARNSTEWTTLCCCEQS